MEEKPYPFSLVRTEYRYEFLSVSPNKEVKKIVLLSQTDLPYIFNLALLDVLENGETSDISVTNNDDFSTVLATVIHIINDFLNNNANFFVIFRGSDQRRQRLYRIIIRKEFEKISKKFRVFGVKNSVPYPFEANIKYDFYLIGKI